MWKSDPVSRIERWGFVVYAFDFNLQSYSGSSPKELIQITGSLLRLRFAQSHYFVAGSRFQRAKDSRSPVAYFEIAES